MVSLKCDQVHNEFLLASGPGPFPGLLDMWGGGGGLLEYRSALLASRGFVAFALEYFAPGELQTANLQLQYFEVCVVRVSTFCVRGIRCFIDLI